MVCASRINNTLRSLRFARLQARLHDPSSGTRLISFSRFVSTLVILEHREGKLDLGSTKAISAGIEFGGTITGLLAGKNIENIGREAAQVLGLDKVLTIKTQSGHDQVNSHISNKFLLAQPLNLIYSYCISATS